MSKWNFLRQAFLQFFYYYDSLEGHVTDLELQKTNLWDYSLFPAKISSKTLDLLTTLSGRMIHVFAINIA